MLLCHDRVLFYMLCVFYHYDLKKGHTLFFVEVDEARGPVARHHSDLDAHGLRLLHMGRNHHRTHQRPQLDPGCLRRRIKMAPQGALQCRDEPQTDRAIMRRLHVVGDVPFCQVHEDWDELRVYRGLLFP